MRRIDCPIATESSDGFESGRQLYHHLRVAHQLDDSHANALTDWEVARGEWVSEFFVPVMMVVASLGLIFLGIFPPAYHPPTAAQVASGDRTQVLLGLGLLVFSVAFTWFLARRRRRFHREALLSLRPA